MRKTTAEITIVSILWLCIFTSIFLKKDFEIRFVFGIVSLLGVTTCLIFKKNDWALSFLIFVLSLSVFDVVRFSAAFGVFVGRISVFPFSLLIALLISIRNQILDLKDKWFAVEPQEIENSRINKIALFKREFQSLSSDELIRKANNDKLVDEAKTAIQQILSERDMTTHNTFIE
jgi:hypothetical protein